MSRQMPMTDVLNESFSFALNRFWTVVRALLVPYLLMTFGLGIVFVALIDFQAIMALADAPDIEESPEAVLALLMSMFRVSIPVMIAIFTVASLILSLPLMGGMTSLYRLVGLGEEPGGWFNLRFDAPMWRMVIATIIFTLIQYALAAIGYGIAIALNPDFMVAVSDVIAFFRSIDFATSDVGYEPDQDLLLSLAGTLVLGWLIAFVLSMAILTKLAPFVAATACENRLMLISSWHMTRGNFWTILFGYIILVIGIIAIHLVYGIASSLVQMVLTMISFGILAIPLAIADFAFQIALALFSIGVQCGWGGTLYRKLWVESATLDGNGEAGLDV